LILAGEVSLRSTRPTLLPPLDCHATRSPVFNCLAIMSSLTKLPAKFSCGHKVAQAEHLAEKVASLRLKIGAKHTQASVPRRPARSTRRARY
jgi:hypothetical protein